MERIKLFIAAFVMAMLTGCGHNAIQYGKGVGFNAGFDPEHMSARVELIYGEMINVAARDNFEIELVSDMEGGDEQATASAKTGTALKIKFGQQINGYTVEAIEAGASARDLVRPLPEASAEQPQSEAKE